MPSESGQPDRDAETRGDALEEVLDRYLQELADGRDPDQDSCLRAHPELADALRGVFKTLDFVEATSKSLNASKLERGQQLGEFRIVREVARGGMGVVYEAMQTSLARRVALKVLPAGALLSQAAPERFRREAAMAGKLHHTNIVPVYAVGEEQGIHYYAMQFIEGRSLAEHLKEICERGTSPGHDYHRRVARWGRQVADALAYAHGAGIIHRDIKPANLLLDAHDNVWIADFGLARGDALASLTLTGDIVGTARYMSPEQARGGRTQLDERTDIYSLGATLYELLVFVPAFDGESREAVLNRIAFADPRPLRQINRALPRDLETIVAKCMEKEPARRYEHAGEVADDFRRFVNSEPIRARRTPLIVKAGRFVRKHRIHALGALTALVLAVAAGGLALKLRHERGARLLDDALTALLYDRDYRGSARLLDEAGALGVGSTDWHVCRGLIPLLNNEPQRAFEHLDRALRKDPAHVTATLAKALAYNSVGDFVNGQRLLQQTEGVALPTALDWLLRGLAQSKSDRSEAIESYDRAIALQPDFTPAIEPRALYRGTRLLTEGRRAELDPMLSDFDALVVFRPQSASSFTVRARGWLIASAYAATHPDLREFAPRWLENCRSDLDKALELRRADDSAPLLRRGVYLRFIGDFRGAAAAFGEVLEVDRRAKRVSHPYRYYERAACLHALGEFQTALDEIESECEAAPSFCPLVLQRALLLAELGRLDEARLVCAESIRQQRLNANGLFMSAVVMELLGDTQAAAAAIREFARDDAQRSTDNVALETAAPALDFLLGRLDGPALLATARDAPGHRCEAAFLVALRNLASGDRPAGVAALQTCVDTGVYIFTEYRFSRTLLERARSDPDWPAWVVRRP